MKKFVAPLAALSFVFAVGTASADEASGKITSMSQETKEITLDNGMTFTLSEEISMDSLEEGADVNVTYEEDGDKKTATEVSPKE